MTTTSPLRTILLFGIIGGALIALLQFIQYRYLIIEYSVELYGVLIAGIFAAVGIWLGSTIVRAREVVREIAVHVEVPVAPSAGFVRDDAARERLGITERELEVLALIAQGLSTRVMADRIHVSENTVKTHASRVFAKLGARRRTQAVQLGQQQRLIP